MSEIQQQAVKTLIEKVAEMIDAKISQNNSFYVSNKFKNWRVTGNQIAPHSIEGHNLADGSIPLLKVQDFAARFAEIAVAEIETAIIDTANIRELEAYVATVANARIANAIITGAQIENASITTAKIALGAITTALIETGAIGTAQIADGSITDAKVVSLNADVINAGTLAIERLLLKGANGLFYAINATDEGLSSQQLSQDEYKNQMSGTVLVARSVTADKIAAKTITANEIFSGTITGDEISGDTIEGRHVKAGEITTGHITSNFGEMLNLTSNIGINQRVTKIYADMEQEIQNSIPEVGGVNLVDNSRACTISGNDTDTSYWIAADELYPNRTHTLSVREIIKDAGVSIGVTWAVMDMDTGVISESGTLEFTYGKQVRTFTTPATQANWGLVLYPGISGATNGVTVTYNYVQLEEGTLATTWKPSINDSNNQVSELGNSIAAMEAGFDAHVQALIDEMGLSDQFASVEDFLAMVEQIGVVQSEFNQQADSIGGMFTRLTASEDSITTMFSHFEFGDAGGTPYLDMWASSSSMRMRLTNTRLSFMHGAIEVAYFSDNKLYVTQLEVTERISVGTSANGYLDIVTTPSGVGFKWRV